MINNITKIGFISNDECEEIKNLHTQKETLLDVFNSLATSGISDTSKEEIYNRLLKDIAQQRLQISEWWKVTSQKYHWQARKDGKWQINYDSREVFLVIDDSSS